MGRDSGQFQIGTVNHGAFTATFFWTHQVLETLPAQTAPILLLTCRTKRKRKKSEREDRSGQQTERGQDGENPGKISQQGSRKQKVEA